jgi:hypothetical protein
VTAGDSARGAPRAEPPARAALVVAHPGHELRVHGWVERARPIVFVLTDGSGSRGTSRLASTSRLLERLGARPGSIYGIVTDRRLYEAMLAGDRAWFSDVAARLLDAFRTAGVDVVAADALEGVNPAHDLCRHLVDAVVARARRGGRPIASYAFALDAPQDTDTSPLPGSLCIDLADDALARKVAAARSYRGLDEAIDTALASHGAEAFRREVLWPADQHAVAPEDPPYYEWFGEQRRQQGVYRDVIRRAAHVEPLAAALRRFGDDGG